MSEADNQELVSRIRGFLHMKGEQVFTIQDFVNKVDWDHISMRKALSYLEDQEEIELIPGKHPPTWRIK